MEARASRAYRDELDALRERAVKADKLESEVGRYREQLHKIDFYKAKAEVGPSPGGFSNERYWEFKNPKSQINRFFLMHICTFAHGSGVKGG